MYTDFYKLKGFPFQLTPDCRFFFDSRPHRKAMAYLTYGLSKGEGFVVITGEVGAGKTTLIDYLLSTLQGSNLVTARIVTTQIQANDLLRMVARQFGLGIEGANKATIIGRLEEFLVQNFRADKRSFLIVDEAQSLAPSSLEELRMLSNFEVGERPLLQIYLVGQPEFRATMAHRNLEQLRQRVIASYHLVALAADEIRGYIEHRLQHVGWHDDPSFEDAVFDKIHAETGGVPRKINVLCDRLLLFGYLEEKHRLTVDDVDEVVIDMREEMAAPAETGQPIRATRARAANGGKSDIDKLASRIGALEKLLRTALLHRTPAEDERSPADAAFPANAELDRLLQRIAELEKQVKERGE